MQMFFRHWLDAMRYLQLSVACSPVFTVGFYLKTDTNCSVYKFHAKDLLYIVYM